jgi:hypothetical protein
MLVGDILISGLAQELINPTKYVRAPLIKGRAMRLLTPRPCSNALQNAVSDDAVSKSNDLSLFRAVSLSMNLLK